MQTQAWEERKGGETERGRERRDSLVKLTTGAVIVILFGQSFMAWRVEEEKEEEEKGEEEEGEEEEEEEKDVFTKDDGGGDGGNVGCGRR